ncbi:MAG TPA: DUF4349 domain-containing protein [Clostridia bacterium]|nr:DUF4349 domain-containing protein [Clostridia bacterium]
MNCEQASELMSAYIDEELTPGDTEDFEKHLVTCERCRSELQGLRIVVDAARSLPEVDLPSGFHERLLERLKATSGQRGVKGQERAIKVRLAKAWPKVYGTVRIAYRAFSRSPYKGVAIAAAVVLAFYLGFMGGRFGPQGVPKADTAMYGGQQMESAAQAPAVSGRGGADAAGEGEQGLRAKSDEMAPASEQIRAMADVRGLEPGAGAKTSEMPPERMSKEMALPAAGMGGGDSDVVMRVERKIIKQADLEIVVAPGKFGDAQRELVVIAESNGGYVEESSVWLEGQDQDIVLPGFSEKGYEPDAGAPVMPGEKAKDLDAARRQPGQRRGGRFVLRIPEDSFSKAVNAVRALGEVRSETIGGRDVTSQFIDLNARVDALHIQEDRLLGILAQAKTVDEMLRIENELSRVRTEIESLTAQMSNLDSLARLSTVVVTVREYSEGLGGMMRPTLFTRMVASFMDTLWKMWELCARIIVFLSGAVPVLILVAVLWFVIRASKSKPRKIKESE